MHESLVIGRFVPLGGHRGDGALLWMITVLVVMLEHTQGFVFEMSVQSLNGLAMNSTMLTVKELSRFLLTRYVVIAPVVFFC
jgi:hypothetical protein